MSYIEEIEILDKEVNEDEKCLEGLKTDLVSRRKKLEVALSETAEEKAALEESREKQIVKIDSSTVQIYTKVISARAGVAVVSLSGDSCGGCGGHLLFEFPETSAGPHTKSVHRCRDDICRWSDRCGDAQRN